MASRKIKHLLVKHLLVFFLTFFFLLEPSLAMDDNEYEKISQNNLNSRIFSISLMDGEIQLYEKKVRDDGDCGYWALGTSRQDATELLLENIHREKIRNLIAPEIYDMLPQLPKNHPVVQQLQGYQLNLSQQEILAKPYQQICTDLNNLFQRQEGERWDGDRLWEHCQKNLISIQQNPQQNQAYQSFQSLREQIQQNEEERLQICSQQDAIACYIKNFMQIPVGDYFNKYNDNNWLNYSSIMMSDQKYRTYAMNAIAYLLNKNLIILTENEEIRHKYQFSEDLITESNSLFLLHIGNYHFNKLLPSKIIEKESILLEEEKGQFFISESNLLYIPKKSENLKPYESEEILFDEGSLLLAVEKGDENAMYLLGTIYDQKKDFKKAKEFFLLASKKGHKDAQAELGIIPGQQILEEKKKRIKYIQDIEEARKYRMEFSGNSFYHDAMDSKQIRQKIVRAYQNSVFLDLLLESVKHDQNKLNKELPSEEQIIEMIKNKKIILLKLASQQGNTQALNELEQYKRKEEKEKKYKERKKNLAINKFNTTPLFVEKTLEFNQTKPSYNSIPSSSLIPDPILPSYSLNEKTRLNKKFSVNSNKYINKPYSPPFPNYSFNENFNEKDSLLNNKISNSSMEVSHSKCCKKNTANLLSTIFCSPCKCLYECFNSNYWKDCLWCDCKICCGGCVDLLCSSEGCCVTLGCLCCGGWIALIVLGSLGML